MKRFITILLMLTAVFMLVSQDIRDNNMKPNNDTQRPEMGKREQEFEGDINEKIDNIMATYVRELKLTGEQYEVIRAIVVEKMEYFKDNKPEENESRTDFRKKMDQLKKANEKFNQRICDELSSDQQKKFKELQAENDDKRKARGPRRK